MMSLLDRKAPHTVLVQNRKVQRNERGQQVMLDVGGLQPVRCMVEPARDWSQAEEDRGVGLQMVNLAIIYARNWPGDINSTIQWNGALWETTGAPQAFKVSRRTRHWRITTQWVKEL
jgi:hypothetical protein